MKFTLWLEFEEWESKSDDDPYNDYFNMQIMFENGENYALNVWTVNFFESELKELGKIGKAKYLMCPDLIIEKMDRGVLEQCIMEMIKKGELKKEWLIKNDKSHLQMK